MSTLRSLIDAALSLEQSDAGNFDALVAAFEKCHRADPENIKMKEKYLSYFKKVFDRQHSNNENADELKQLGNQHLLKQQYDESILFYDAAISVDSMAKEAAPIYSNRSLAFFSLGKFKDAHDDAQMAVALNPEFARGYLRQAMSAMKLEKYDESLKAFEKYCEMEPDAKNDNAVSSNIAAVRKAITQQMKMKKEKEKIIARINTLFQRGETESDEFERICDNASENLDAEITRRLACCWDLSPYRTSCSALTNLVTNQIGRAHV